jgi:hypothetical protein
VALRPRSGGASTSACRYVRVLIPFDHSCW